MIRWIAVLVVLASPSISFAKCAYPGAFVVPEADELPPDPTLHLFFHGSARVTPEVAIHDQAGRQVPFEVVALEGAMELQALRITVRTGDASSITVALDASWPPEGRNKSYRIVDAESLAPRERLRLDEVADSSYEWSCSYEEARILKIASLAPVHRVEWSRSEADFREGRRAALLFPLNLRKQAFRWSGDERVRETAAIPLGYVNCFGPTLDWDDGPIWVGVVGVYPDGSETPMSLPVRVEPPRKWRALQR